jgi:hemolysin activation/secretion protein
MNANNKHRATRAAFSRLQLLALTVVLTLPAHALAQTAGDARNAARQAEIFQQRQQEQLQRERDGFLRPGRPSGANLDVAPPAAAAAPEGVCHTIQVVDIRDAEHLSRSVRAAINEQFVGRCLGTGEISSIIGLIVKDYIEHGYVTTRAYLPEQNLAGGTLRIDVVEGRIERYQPAKGMGRDTYLPGAFPAAAGEVLNLRDLEQGVDQLNRLQSNNASINILPGSGTGDSVVEVINQRRSPWHIFLSYDNQGSKSTGQDQVTLNLVLDSVLGFNEMLSATWRESSPLMDNDHRSDMQAISLAIPWGYNTFGLDLNQSRYYNAVQLPSGLEMPATGTSYGDSVYWSRVLTRDHVSRLTLTESLGVKTARNYFAGQYLDVSSRTLSFADLKLSYTRNLSQGYVSVDLDHVRGLKMAGALRDVPALAGNEPHAQFVKNTLDVRYSTPFELGEQQLGFESQLFVQRADTALYGSEQLFLGSLSSVRGFSLNTLSGDHGYYWRNTVSMPWNTELAGNPLSGRLYFSLDRGSVHSYNTDLPYGQITGAAMGLQLGWHNVSLDMIYAAPVSVASGMSREPGQFWFRLSTGF